MSSLKKSGIQQQISHHIQRYKKQLWDSRSSQEKRTLRLGCLALAVLLCGWQLHAQTEQSKQLTQNRIRALAEHAELLQIQAQSKDTPATHYTFTAQEQHQALEHSITSPQFEPYLQLTSFLSATQPHWRLQVEAMPASLLTQWLFQVPNQLQLNVEMLTVQRSQKEGRELSAMLSGEIQLQPKERK